MTAIWMETRMLSHPRASMDLYLLDTEEQPDGGSCSKPVCSLKPRKIRRGGHTLGFGQVLHHLLQAQEEL